MEPRRLAAIGALAVIAVGAVALLTTGGADDEPVASPTAADDAVDATADPDASAADAAAGSSEPAAAPEASDTVDASDATAVGEADAATGADAESVALRYDPELVPELPDRGPHTPLTGIDGWLQSDITSLDELEGRVVAVQFWTFGCHNCRATMPHMAALYEKYGGDDFEIVGVHAPEFDRERDPDAIAAAAVEQNITWPIALDTEKRSFRTWQTERRFWPRIYLLDRDGDVRYDKIGEGRYDEIDAAVGALIDEPWDAELAAELDEWVERDVDENSDPM